MNNQKKVHREPPLFTVRQDFRAFRISYFAHGSSVTVQHLAEKLDTIFDLVEAWPHIMEWLRAQKYRSIGLSIDGETDTALIYTEIDHADSIIHGTRGAARWIVNARKG